jgi:hypothetical protein
MVKIRYLLTKTSSLIGSFAWPDRLHIMPFSSMYNHVKGYLDFGNKNLRNLTLGLFSFNFNEF